MLGVIGLATTLLFSILTADALNTTTIPQNASPRRPSISASSSTNGVGDFIASGLGLQQDSSAAAPQSSTVAPVSSSNNTLLLSSNATTAPPSLSSAGTSGNGSIAASALSCVASQSSYRSAADSFESSHMSTFLTTVISTLTYGKLQWRSSQTAYITLCDGLPRGLGVPTPLGNSTTVTSTMNTTFTTSTLSASPTFAPPTCSIDPSDCALLLSSWTRAVDGEGSHPRPTCTTTAPPVVSSSTSLVPSSTSLVPSSTASFIEINGVCQGQCIIAGQVHSDEAESSTAGVRLFYWPVTRVGNVCNGTSTEAGTATGDGPNTYADPDVLGSLTITSPSVAISFGRLSRLDGCGTTLSNYITIMDPQNLTSQRGARALQEFKSFDYADLNTKCVSSANVTGCYTDVPSAAYFGQNKCGGFDDEWCPQTIYNNYAPQLLIPWMSAGAMPPSWGNSTCIGYPEGGWDPPIALSSAGGLAGPKPTSAETTTGNPRPTAQPENKPTSTPSKTGGGGGGDGPKTTSSAGGAGGLPGAIASEVGQGASKSKTAANPTSGGGAGSDDGDNDQGAGQSGGSDSSGSGSSGSDSPGSGSSGSDSNSEDSNPGSPGDSDNRPDPSDSGSSSSGGSSNGGSSGSSGPDSSEGSASGSGSGSGSGSSDPSVNGGSDSNASGSSAGASGEESGSGGSGSGGPSDPTTVGVLGGASVAADPSNSNNAVIGGTTFTAGQQTTINNVPVSIGSSGEVVAGTSIIQGAASGDPAPSASPIGIVGGSPVVVDPATTGAVIVGGHTIQNGQSTNVDNTPIAVSSGNVIIGGGSGNTPASTIAIPTSSSGNTIGGQPIVVSSGVVVIGSSTLSAGQQTTIDGTVVSAGSTQLVVGSSTIPVAPTGSTSNAAGAQFTGAASSVKSMHFGVSGAFVFAWFAFSAL